MDQYLKVYYNAELNKMGLGVYFQMADYKTIVWFLDTGKEYIEIDPDTNWLDGWELVGELETTYVSL